MYFCPPCTESCPAGVDIPRYIRHIRNGNFDKALAAIRERIPFPYVCSLACVAPCESACARIQYDEPVAIRMLKRAAAEYSKSPFVKREKAPYTGNRVAVIGAGPSGLSAAYFLAKKGHRVMVFELLPAPGGMLRYGIPEYRLPNHVVDDEISFIKDQGVEITTNTKIDSPKKLLNSGFDAVLVTTGAWKARKMGIEGEDSSQVIDGISFLKQVNTGTQSSIGKRVVVVGGGNTAVDAARAGIRLGAEVIQLYRRTRLEMPASSEEIDEAIEEGVKIRFLTAPVRAKNKKIECIGMELGPIDDSGRPRPVPVNGSEITIDCDTVIMAIGEYADAGALNLCANRNGTVSVNPETLATSQRGIFAAGDVVSGPSTIIEAIAKARLASISIDRFLGGDGIIDEPAETGSEAVLPDIVPHGTERPNVERITLKDRICSFGLAEYGYDKNTAINEAKRCLACDIREFFVEVDPILCKNCGYCNEVCTLEIFHQSDTFNPNGYKPVVAVNTMRCVGCLKCLYVCPDFAIKIR